MAAENRLTIHKKSAGYWNVVISNPPTNMFDPLMFAELNVLVEEMEKSPDLRIVVFESADPDFFMNHHDVVHRLEVPDVPGAKAFFYNWPYFEEKLVHLPVLSVAKVRGRARAQGFEFALACDIRFASRERALFSLVEAAGASIPGGGGIEWLVRLCGRSRALEIVCSAEDYDADTGELYGFVNRALPDAKLDAFVEAFATRIASFDKAILDACKKTINERAALPSLGELLASNHQLYEVDYQWPKPEGAFEKVMAAGLGQKGEFELNLPYAINDLS